MNLALTGSPFLVLHGSHCRAPHVHDQRRAGCVSLVQAMIFWLSDIVHRVLSDPRVRVVVIVLTRHPDIGSVDDEGKDHHSPDACLSEVYLDALVVQVVFGLGRVGVGLDVPSRPTSVTVLHGFDLSSEAFVLHANSIIEREQRVNQAPNSKAFEPLGHAFPYILGRCWFCLVFPQDLLEGCLTTPNDACRSLSEAALGHIILVVMVPHRGLAGRFPWKTD